MIGKQLLGRSFDRPSFHQFASHQETIPSSPRTSEKQSVNSSLAHFPLTVGIPGLAARTPELCLPDTVIGLGGVLQNPPCSKFEAGAAI